MSSIRSFVDSRKSIFHAKLCNKINFKGIGVFIIANHDFNVQMIESY